MMKINEVFESTAAGQAAPGAAPVQPITASLVEVWPNSFGFTLLEALVVVAIIAILAGLVLSAVVKSGHRAKSAACQNNLSQMGIWLEEFVEKTGEYPLQMNVELTNRKN